MAANPSNENILQQLRHGIAHFEIATSPVPSVSSNCTRNLPSFAFVTSTTQQFFARIRPAADTGLVKTGERYSVQRVTGDGRCMFRALVKGMALNKGIALGQRQEREGADGNSSRMQMETYHKSMTDELRMAVKEIICDNEKEHHQFEEAIIAITVEESLRRYCQRIGRPDFWGGEAELLVLSRLCSQPIVVYIPEHEHGGWGSGFIPIQEYGSEFRKDLKKGKPRKVVRLLYSGRNHYDLLV